MKSVEQRLEDAHHALALIIVGLKAEQSDLPYAEERLQEAIYEAAVRAHNELHWLRELPAEILKADAPDYDDRDELVAGGAR